MEVPQEKGGYTGTQEGRYGIAAAAAVLGRGTITAVADYMKRSKAEGMQVKNQQQTDAGKAPVIHRTNLVL